MKFICEENKCTACSACVDICRHNAINLIDTFDTVNVVIDNSKCVKCNMCKCVCPVNNPIELKKPLMWYQGWSNDGNIRNTSSSGGAAAELSKSFINIGGYVASCVFDGENFNFMVTNSEKDIEKFKGSKYVKSNPQGIYKSVKSLLDLGEKVLFIGLPCQCAAMSTYIKRKENLYLVDLICHGTPSINTLKLFLKQNGTKIDTFSNIKFRDNNKFGLNLKNNPGITDPFLISFLYCLNYTNNCYQCTYAGIERCSDFTIGDSWGSELHKEKDKGISLILCQSGKGDRLLKMCNMHLQSVDIDEAIRANSQLNHPSVKSIHYDTFFKTIKSDGSYKRAVFRAFPKQTIKQYIKYLLILLKLYPRMYK